jgi:phenylpyruvate tautomerase PptA (4-oxalocrotonate tautomerase family)
MPLVKVWVQAGRSASEKRGILDAVHRSLVEALRIPDDDRTQLVLEHEGIEVPTGMTQGFTLVEVFMREGRSVEMKQALYERVFANLEGLGTRPSDVVVAIHEVPLENWGFPRES